MTQRIYSLEEMQRLASIHESYYDLFERLVDEVNLACKDEDCEARIVHTSRTHDEQLALYEIGRKLEDPMRPTDPTSWRTIDAGKVVTHALPGESAHGCYDLLEGRRRWWALAIDLALIDQKTLAWLRGGSMADADARWSTIVGATAEHLGLEWGGRFTTIRGGKRVPFFDGAHVQVPNWRTRARELGLRF